jgi:serine/threonine protein kinase
VGADDTVKVTDFGISACQAATITSSGRISGTAAYVSPEVANGEGAKASSDIFSLGATLFAAVEGTPPFGTGDPDAVLARVREARGEPATQAGPLEPVLAALLRRERDHRPSAAQAKDMLAAVATGKPIPVWTPEKAYTPRKRSLLAAAAISVVAAVLLTFLRPWDTEPARTALGFPRTADPCSVADTTALQDYRTSATPPSLHTTAASTSAAC